MTSSKLQYFYFPCYLDELNKERYFVRGNDRSNMLACHLRTKAAVSYPYHDMDPAHEETALGLGFYY